MSTPFKPVQIANRSWVEKPLSAQLDAHRLIERWASLTTPVFVVGETGFGSGVNFLLAWSIWDKIAPPDAHLYFISSEKHPLSLSCFKESLEKWPELSHYAAALIDAYPVLTPGYHRVQFADGRVTLDLMLGDALSMYQGRLLCGDVGLEHSLRQDTVDAWFLNEDSLGNNPNALCATLFQLSNSGTTLSTLTVEEGVNAALQSAGFEITQSDDMGIWTVPNQSHQSTKLRRETPWHVGSTTRVKTKEALIIGAGLSGCMMANRLAKRGWQVQLIDERATVGQGASGNRRSILFPNLSAYHAPLTELMLAAFLYAARFYRQCITQWPVGEFSGILQLVRDKKTNQTQADLATWLKHYPELGRWVDASLASTLTGVEVASEGIFIPLAGWIDSPALCERLIQHPHVHFYPNTSVPHIEQDAAGVWHAAGHHAEVLVLANGHAANQFSQTHYLEVKALRGQMTDVKTSEQSQHLQIPLCGEGHILPASAGQHAIGATFGLYSDDDRCQPTDDVENVSKINALAAALNLSSTVVSHWAGVRGAALDHLPLIGPIVDAQRFKTTFEGFHSNSKRWIPASSPCYEGLYMASGFGSRGVTTVPLCTEYLASLINHEPVPLSQQLARAISPARFMYRAIVRGCTSTLNIA